jgi:hypothetical protein
MRDYKCIACRTRTRHAGDTHDGAGDRCPSCGSPLELVSDLTQIVGFRAFATADPAIADAAPLGDFTAHRNAMYAQRVRDALDAERWMDDGGHAVAAVVAVALPTADGAGPTHRLGIDVT